MRELDYARSATKWSPATSRLRSGDPVDLGDPAAPCAPDAPGYSGYSGDAVDPVRLPICLSPARNALDPLRAPAKPVPFPHTPAAQARRDFSDALARSPPQRLGRPPTARPKTRDRAQPRAHTRPGQPPRHARHRRHHAPPYPNADLRQALQAQQPTSRRCWRLGGPQRPSGRPGLGTQGAGGARCYNFVWIPIANVWPRHAPPPRPSQPMQPTRSE